MASKKNDDWFEALDEELEKTAQEIVKDISQTSKKKMDFTKTLLADLWRVWLRFNRINITFKMEPDPYSFLRFKAYPTEWELKEENDEVDYGSLNSMALIDVSPFQNRTGDSLKIFFYPKDGETYIKMIFEFCEGEHYYKLAGWKRIFVQYILYDAPLKKAKLDDMHDIMGDIVKVWYESHLRKNRDTLIDHIKSNYIKGEEFPQ